MGQRENEKQEGAKFEGQPSAERNADQEGVFEEGEEMQGTSRDSLPGGLRLSGGAEKPPGERGAQRLSSAPSDVRGSATGWEVRRRVG